MQFQEKNEPTQKTSSTSLTEKRQTLGSSCTITKPKQQKNPIISSEKGQTLGSSGNITKSKFQPPQKQQQKNTISLTEKGSRWQEGDLLILMKEISVRNPFQTKKGSPQRRMAWQDIAENCEKSSITIPVSERVVRERFQIVKDKFLRKMRAEEKGSGITCTYSELEQLMQDLIDLECDCEKEATESKKENTEHDREKAINIRKRCMERMGDPGKRKKNKDNDRMDFFRERNESMMRDREEERKLRKAELDLRKEETGLMKDQQKLFQDSLLQMQAQQSQMMQLLLQKLEK
ncbi:golgin subfamily A member 6-like protein 22 isoform X2 [Hydractinia symbiolongicarpus]|uniref:golgin subfamily A member 6-like protein 22 isoform X2 n=1 Tax=Hydractinia symbiolongicarpus TaxID=13093 RepID=UPI00255163FC|nr:golgin subfamily A member 6-like protein 22 isoform X2 [Hydractinia symbiolongicarpus]